jgi:hypothetical protein
MMRIIKKFHGLPLFLSAALLKVLIIVAYSINYRLQGLLVDYGVKDDLSNSNESTSSPCKAVGVTWVGQLL